MLTLKLLLQPRIPLAGFDVCIFLLQVLVAALVLPDFDDGMLPIPGIQFLDQMRHEALVVEGLLGGGQARASRLALLGGRLHIPILPVMLAAGRGMSLTAGLVLQEAREEVAQGVGGQTGGIEGVCIADLVVVPEQVRDLCEGGGSDTMAT
jgi:hypothetical protein